MMIRQSVTCRSGLWCALLLGMCMAAHGLGGAEDADRGLLLRYAEQERIGYYCWQADGPDPQKPARVQRSIITFSLARKDDGFLWVSGSHVEALDADYARTGQFIVPLGPCSVFDDTGHVPDVKRRAPSLGNRAARSALEASLFREEAAALRKVLTPDADPEIRELLEGEIEDLIRRAEAFDDKRVIEYEPLYVPMRPKAWPVSSLAHYFTLLPKLPAERVTVGSTWRARLTMSATGMPTVVDDAFPLDIDHTVDFIERFDGETRVHITYRTVKGPDPDRPDAGEAEESRSSSDVVWPIPSISLEGRAVFEVERGRLRENEGSMTVAVKSAKRRGDKPVLRERHTRWRVAVLD